MSRFPNPRGAVASALIIGAGVLSSALTVRPVSHNYGQVVVGSSKNGAFVVTYLIPSGLTDTLVTQIVGPDAADFSVSLGGPLWVGATPPAGSCLLRLPRGSGTCNYDVDFNPTSVGNKTATLEITDMNGKGTTVQATLLGEGFFSCRPYLVSCNYADFYSGSFTEHMVDSIARPDPSKKGRWETTIDITIVKGVATCSGVQTDWEEGYNGAMLMSRSTVNGVINGPGLFAVEFRGSGSSMEYIMTWSCPSAKSTTYTEEYVYGPSGVVMTPSTYNAPADAADWRHAGLGADPQPATQIGMVDLIGKQTDVRFDPGSGVGGYTGMVWSIKRW